LANTVKRILVGLQQTELGGSPLNGVDLATAIRDRGYDVHVFATYHEREPGPVAEMVRDRDLQLTLVHTRSPGPRRCALFRPRVAHALVSVVRSQRIDLVHAYEPHLILDAFYGPHLLLRTPVLGTWYTMGSISTWLPKHTPLIAGTKEVADEAKADGRPCVLIEPPVNTDTDDPGAVDGSQFRRPNRFDTLHVIVSRLHPEMKQEGIERAIDAMRALPGRLLVVGDGPSRAVLTARAERVNADVGRQAVEMLGPLADPRPAYAAADVVLGMGASALRGMAFAKPLVVLGIGGFSLECTPETASRFFSEGFYGVGDGRCAPLVDQVRRVLARREELGRWGRKTIVERYSLHAAADVLERVYRTAAVVPHWTVLRAAAGSGARKFVAEALPGRLRQRVRPLVRRVFSH